MYLNTKPKLPQQPLIKNGKKITKSQSELREKKQNIQSAGKRERTSYDCSVLHLIGGKRGASLLDQ